MRAKSTNAYHSRLRAANGAALTVLGNVSSSSAGDGNYGLQAQAGSTIAMTGDYTTSGMGGRLEIGSNGALKIGGNFAPGSVWDGYFGSFWSVDTSSTPGRFVLNGGGTPQTFEVMSNSHGVSGDSLITQVGSGVARVPFGSIFIGEDSTPAAVSLVNNVNLAGVDNQQVARNLTVTSGSTLDLNGFRMVVAIGDLMAQFTAWISSGNLLNTGGVELLPVYSEPGNYTTIQTQTIPEPLSGVLLALGAGLACLRQRAG